MTPREFPWLMQRLVSQVREDRPGLDRYFRFDYMGSAEFEFGTIPKTLKSFRASKYERNPCKLKVTRTDKPFELWFIGANAQRDLAQRMFQKALNGERIVLKESLALYRAIEGEGLFEDSEPTPEWNRVHGWLAVDADPPWAVFLTQQNAHNWLKGLAFK